MSMEEEPLGNVVVPMGGDLRKKAVVIVNTLM